MTAKRGRPPAKAAEPEPDDNPKRTTSIGIRRDLADRLKEVAVEQDIPFVTFTNLVIESVLENADFEVTKPSVVVKMSRR